MTKSPSPYHIGYILFIILLCAYAFKGFTTHPWSYDDLDHIKHAQLAQSNISHLIAAEVKEPARVVLNIYFYIAYNFFGQNPAAYHTIKIAFHILNSLLLTYVFLTLFKDTKLSALSGFLFAIHGTHYEAIYHIAGTGYLLCTCFALLAVLFTHHSLTNLNKFSTLAALLSYATSVFSYEGAIVIIVPLLYLWWTSASGKNNRSFYFPLALVCIVCSFLIIEKWGFNYINTKANFYHIGLGWHIPHTFFLFMGRIFINSHITPLGWASLPPKDIPRDHIDLYVGMGVLLFAFLLHTCKKSQIIRFLTLWLSITILPTTIGTNDYYYTRYFYLPAIGASGITAYFMCWAYNKLSLRDPIKQLTFTIVFMLLTLSGLHKLHIFEGYFLFNTANYYASPNYANAPNTAISLYERAQSQYQIKDHVLSFNLASCYEQTSQNAKALEHYQEAIQINPKDARSYHASARIFLYTGQIEQAIFQAQKAAQLNTQYIDEYHKLGTILYNSNYIEEARSVFQNALQIDAHHPHNDLVYFNLGGMYQNEGKIQDAIQAYQKASDLHTDIVEVYQNLGTLYLQQQKWLEAISALTQATKRDASQAQPWQKLGYALTQTGQQEAAQSAYQNAKRAQSTP